VGNDTYICDDSLNKMARTNYKNMSYLYDVIGQDKELKESFFVPMGCIVNYKGFMCHVLSKVEMEECNHKEREYSTSNSGKLFDRLSSLARVGFQIFEKDNCISFQPRSHRRDTFAIIHAHSFLP
jgi:hypothetical protein